MAEELLVGVDVGTSGVDACAVSCDGALIAVATVPLHVAYPRPGWAEQDPAAWPRAALAALRRLSRELGPRVGHVAAIGLTGQCPSVALLDGSGRPLTSGLIHQDNRATVEAQLIAQIIGPAQLTARTGMPPSQFYLASKALWLGAHDAELRAAGPWLAQPRDMVAQCLTGLLATDETHAGCTGLYDVVQGGWASDWLERLDMDWLRLPPILRPTEPVGRLTREAADETGLPAGLTVVIGAADNFCADLALGAMTAGILGDTSGTTTCLDLTVDAAHFMPGRAVLGLSFYAHFMPGRLFVNAGLNATGATIAWAAALLAGGDLARFEALARSARPLASAPLLLPYLGDGDRADATATGVWHGLSLSHDPARLARSVYEGLTFALCDLLDGFRTAGFALREARLAGGGSRSTLWNGLKADVWGMPVRAAEHTDATAMGAAYLAGVGAGLYRDVDDAAAHAVRLRSPHEPDPQHQCLYAELYQRWRALKG